MHDTYTPDEFQRAIDTGDYILIDLRTYQERWEWGYIAGTTKCIDVYLENTAELIQSLDKSKKYLIYCWHARRSAQVLWYMNQLWFSHVIHLWWGTDMWLRSWKTLIKEKLDA